MKGNLIKWWKLSDSNLKSASQLFDSKQGQWFGDILYCEHHLNHFKTKNIITAHVGIWSDEAEVSNEQIIVKLWSKNLPFHISKKLLFQIVLNIIFAKIFFNFNNNLTSSCAGFCLLVISLRHSMKTKYRNIPIRPFTSSVYTEVIYSGSLDISWRNLFFFFFPSDVPMMFCLDSVIYDTLLAAFSLQAPLWAFSQSRVS